MTDLQVVPDPEEQPQDAPAQTAVKLSKAQLEAAMDIKSRIQRGELNVTMGGLAGTGKTTVIGQLHTLLGIPVESIAYCAFTGKAATNINRKFPGAMATTIHSLIYKAAEVHCDKCPARGDAPSEDGKPNPRCHALKTGCTECRVVYQQREDLPAGKRLVVVDEASMVPENLAEHLRMYARPIIWVGDHGQLPPVQSKIYLMEDPDIRLETIHRQAKDSPILQLAMKVRETGRLPKPGYEDAAVRCSRGARFSAQEEEWKTDGELAVLVATNKMRNAINTAVRRKRGMPEKEPAIGDRVICLRNNSHKGIFNGMMGQIIEIEPSYFDEYALAIIKIEGEDRFYEGKISLEQFGSPKTLMDIPRSEMDLWDYGYALTVHKSQGSEYRRVILVVRDMGWISDRERWLYTAVTRAKEELDIVYPD